MTGRVRRLAEHLATMETGWRRYAWATAAGLFTALGATAYSLDQPWFGAMFFVFAVALLLMSGWSRWYLRTHRRAVSYVGELGPELVPAGGVMTASAVNQLQEELLRDRAARDRVIAAHQPELGGGGCPLCGVPHPCWTNRELSERVTPSPLRLAFDATLTAEQIEDFKRRFAEGSRRRVHWLLSGGPVSGSPSLRSEDGCEHLLPSPPSTGFPGVEGGETHSTEDGAE